MAGPKNMKKFENFSKEKKEKELVYEEKVELGKISIQSGRFTIFPDDVADINQIEVPVGNDGIFKVIGIYRMTEIPIPPEFSEGEINAKTYNKQLIRLELEEVEE